MSNPSEQGTPASTVETPTLSVPPTRDLPSPDDPTGGPSTRADTEPREFVQPSLVPGYDLLCELGRGAMGVVYQARQTAANRVVALKMILSGSQAGTEERTRFRAEAEAAARLQHPNIVQIFEVGEQQGQPYFSLEYCPEGTLEEKLKGAPVSAQDAAVLLEKLARAMDHAHQHGVLHRDLKPANIMLSSEGSIHPPKAGSERSPISLIGMIPKIGDFGLAKKLDEASQTQAGSIVGTPSYMAPEQADGLGRTLGPACDVYALGAVLYACLTGRPPFRAANVMDTLMQVIHNEPVPPRQLQPTCPRDLETICLKCLHKEPLRRYASASDLADDLRRFQCGEPVRARPVGQWERGWRWCRRNRTSASLLLAVALTLLVGTAVSLGLYYHARVQEQLAVKGFNRARDKEEEARKSEAAQKKAAEEASLLAEKERTRREKAEYLSRIRMAEQLWLAGSISAARETLDETDPALRGWEYGHLYNVLHAPQRTFLGHTDYVNSAVFSPDGRRIVSGSSDKTVKLWDAFNGQELLTLRGHTGPVRAVEFSPNGNHIVSASDDKTLKVWDADKGQELLTLKGHTSFVRSASFSPDGNHIVSASEDKTLKVWDARSGLLLRTLVGHTGIVSSVCFSPDGQRILSGSQDQTLKVWDAASGNPLPSLAGPKDNINSVAYSPDGRRLLTAIGYPGVTSSVTFSPGGKRVISRRTDFPLSLWDADSGKELRIFRGHTDFLSSAVFSPDGRRLASGSADHTVKVWDTLGGPTPLTLRGHTDFVNCVHFSPEGKRLISASKDRTIKVWQADIGQEVLHFTGHTGEFTSLSFSRYCKRILSGNRDKTLKVFDAVSGQELLTLAGHNEFVNGAAFSPDGNRIVSASSDKTVKVWDAVSGRELRTLNGHLFGVSRVSFSPDGQRILSGSQDQTLKLWDANTGQELKTLKGHTSYVSSAIFSPDGQRIISGSGDKTIKVWDAEEGRELLTFTGHTAAVRCVRVSLDGKRLVSGSEDKTLKIWDAESGQELQTLKGHTQSVESASFSPDGQRVVSGSYDQTLKVWDVESGQEFLTLRSHTSAVECVAFSPDGRRIISGGWDGMLKVWDEGRLMLPNSQERRPILRVLAQPDLAWHREQARDSERLGHWFSAAFHYGRLLALHPWDVSAHVGRAFALSQSGRSGEAAVYYLQAIDWLPRASLWPINASVNQAVYAVAESGDWPRAASLYLLAAHQPLTALHLWESLLLAQATARQTAACRRTGSEFLARFGNDKDTQLQWQAAFACRAVPLNEDDAVEWVKKAERWAADHRTASNLDLLGSLLYRAGRHEDAARILDEAIRKQGGGGFVDSWLFLAMARQKLGQPEEARRLFALFENWLKQQPLKSWQEKARWQLLQEEARALIVTMPKVPQDD